MKPQVRPFTVEVKSKHRPLQAHANWSTVDIRDNAADTPFAASRVFSAFATSAISSASTLGDLATSVFAPKPQEQAGDTAPATDEVRIGRILPSLLPVSPFEAAPAQENGRVRKAAKNKPPRRRALEVAEQQEAPEPTEAASERAIALTIAPELSVAVKAPPSSGRKATRRRADARVRAGEGWKRRRLPKACW